MQNDVHSGPFQTPLLTAPWPTLLSSLLDVPPCPLVAPQRAELNERAAAMSAALTRERLSNTVDTTGTTIGKR